MKQVYGQELSKSIADYEKLKVEKEKDLELALEKQKSRLNLIIAGFVACVAFLLIVAIYLQRKQNKKLQTKNDEIKRQNLAIAQSAEERALLFKEMHHRVKNNFQIVTSLLEMQTKKLDHAPSKSLITEGINRIKSMSIIHKHLYKDDELEFGLKDYVIELVEELKALYDPENDVEIEYDLLDIKINIDTAMPLGLVINELVTNAFKYGISDNGGKLKVSTIKLDQNQYELIVADTGKGIDEEFDISNTDSTGLKLVRRLAKQLHGSLRFKYFNGANFYVSWKDLNSST